MNVAPLKLRYAQRNGLIPAQYNMAQLQTAYQMFKEGKATAENFAQKGIDVKTLQGVFNK